MQIDPLLVRVDIQKELRRLPDPRDRVKRVPSAQDREISHSIEFEQIRTGDPEKVSHHQVRIPDRLQLRQTVKDIKRVLSVSSDLVMDRNCEGLETGVRIKLRNLHMGEHIGLRQDRRMLCKPDIDNISLVIDCLRDEWQREHPEFLDIRHLPYNIVAHSDIIQDLIQLRDPALYFVKCCHRGSSFLP